MMATAAAHKFGQIIGDALEAAIEPWLAEFAAERGLYLDRKGPRPARAGRKVSWRDGNGNLHDLDFVIERGGSPAQIGAPVAFIETAWRRYTRHSRNKAQEIQGAIEPLAETYRHLKPFKGVVLAGEFTAGALQQLRSLGFAVLHVTYADIIAAFAEIGIDARYDDDTPDEVMAQKIGQWEAATAAARAAVYAAMLASNPAGLAQFLETLRAAAGRGIRSVVILPLHGAPTVLASAPEAIRFIEGYDEGHGPATFARYEVEVRYSNDDQIRASFAAKSDACAFLRLLEPASHTSMV